MSDGLFDKVLDEQDREFVRVLEDLINALLDQKVITLDMFPERAAAKIEARRDMRDHMAGTVMPIPKVLPTAH